MLAGQIIIEGIECTGRIGVTTEERAEPQRLLVTIHIELPMEPAIHLDSIEEALDYEKVVDDIQSEVASAECHLLETMAARVSRLLLRNPAVERVKVEVFKFPESLRNRISRVSVRLSQDHINRGS